MRLLTKRPENQKFNKREFFVAPSQHETVFCGHRIDVQRPPRTNCKSCWTFFFVKNADFTNTLGKALQAGGRALLVADHGNKLVRNAEKFFAAVAVAKELEARREAEGLQNPETVDIIIPADAPRQMIPAQEPVDAQFDADGLFGQEVAS